MPEPEAPVVIVSSDTHIGPLLRTQLRDDCPAHHLPEFDELVACHDIARDARVTTATGFTAHPNQRTDGHFDVHAACATWTATASRPRSSSTAARTSSPSPSSRSCSATTPASPSIEELAQLRSPEALRSPDKKAFIPPLHGALLKNEQDVHLFERVVFMSRAGR